MFILMLCGQVLACFLWDNKYMHMQVNCGLPSHNCCAEKFLLHQMCLACVYSTHIDGPCWEGLQEACRVGIVHFVWVVRCDVCRCIWRGVQQVDVTVILKYIPVTYPWQYRRTCSVASP